MIECLWCGTPSPTEVCSDCQNLALAVERNPDVARKMLSTDAQKTKTNLVLNLKIGSWVYVGDTEFQLTRFHRGYVRVFCRAPKSVKIDSTEYRQRRLLTKGVM